MTSKSFFKEPFSAHFVGKEHEKRTHIYKEGRWVGSVYCEVKRLNDGFSWMVLLDTRNNGKQALQWENGCRHLWQARHRAKEAMHEYCATLHDKGYPGLEF
jgi:hypothetical protein